MSNNAPSAASHASQGFKGLPSEIKVDPKNAIGKLINTGAIIKKGKEAVICEMVVEVDRCSAGSKIRTVRRLSKEQMEEMLAEGWVDPNVAWGFIEGEEKVTRLKEIAAKNWGKLIELEENEGIPAKPPVRGTAA